MKSLFWRTHNHFHTRRRWTEFCHPTSTSSLHSSTRLLNIRTSGNCLPYLALLRAAPHYWASSVGYCAFVSHQGTMKLSTDIVCIYEKLRAKFQFQKPIVARGIGNMRSHISEKFAVLPEKWRLLCSRMKAVLNETRQASFSITYQCVYKIRS